MSRLENKRIIEAALFVSARHLSLEEMKKLTGVKSKKNVERVVGELQEEYNENGRAMEIVKENEKYLMRLKVEYAEGVKEFAQDVEISKPGLRVLSYIYGNEGNMLKSQVAKKLGNWIYPYVQELVEKDFLSAKKAGRTKRLILTDKFKRYFAAQEKEE